MWHCSVLLLCLGLLRICADRPAPLLSPSCGRILNSLCFLCSYNSPGWLLEAAFCFPEDGTKAPVCSFSLADSGLCFWEHSSYQTSSPQPLAASLRLCSGSGGVPGGVLGLALGRGVLGGGLWVDPGGREFTPRGLRKSWSSEQGLCPFNALWNSYLFPFFPPPSPQTWRSCLSTLRAAREKQDFSGHHGHSWDSLIFHVSCSFVLLSLHLM